MTPKRCRLAVVASHPIQYFTPIYRRLAEVPGIDLRVFFCRDFGVKPRFDEQFGRAIAWDTDQLSGYEHQFLANISPVQNTFNPLHAINPGVFFRLLAGYDALWVHGYLYPSNWLAVAAARIRGTRVLFRSELGTADRGRSRIRSVLRDTLLRRWVHSSDALLYIGRSNRAAYEGYGARDSQLFFTPYSVDVDRLAEAAPGDAGRKTTARESLDIPQDARVVLFAGKLMPHKHPEALLHLGCAAPSHLRIHIVFAGSGALEGQLREDAARLGLSVSFLGFVNQQGMPDVYAAADVLVLPSEREPWGLVVNEGMAAGLPSIVSSAAGSVADLISNGITGFSFPSGDWAAMTTRALQLLGNDDLRKQMGEAARRRSRQYSYDASVRGILDALFALGAYSPPEAPTATIGRAAPDSTDPHGGRL